jgi:hypothetical protein
LHCRRNDYCAKLAERNCSYPILVPLPQYTHNNIAFAYSKALKVVCRPIRELAQVTECKLALLAMVITPHKRKFIRLPLRPLIYNIKPEVKIIGNVDLKVLNKVLI